MFEIDIASDFADHFDIDTHSSTEYNIKGIALVALLEDALSYSISFHPHKAAQLSQLRRVLKLFEKLDILRLVRGGLPRPAS